MPGTARWSAVINRRATTRDGRGRVLPAVSHSALARTETADDSRRQALIQKLRRKTTDAVWQLLGANALWFIIAAALITRFEDRVAGRNALQGIPRMAVIVAVLTAVIGASWWWVSRASWRRRARMAVDAGFCGSCGYDIAALEPEHDGCRVCPECAAAWRPRRRSTTAPANRPGR